MARGPLAGPAGPGKFSTRTDGLSFQPQEYGQGVEMSAIKVGAPLANTPDVRGTTNTEVRQAVGQVMPPKVTPLFASTERPNEPITTGIPMGPGAGPEILRMQPAQEKLSNILAKMIPFDNTGEVAILYQEALARGN